MVGVQRINWRFHLHSAHFCIQLPLRSVRLRLPGEILKDGWLVLYQWGEGAEIEFLEVRGPPACAGAKPVPFDHTPASVGATRSRTRRNRAAVQTPGLPMDFSSLVKGQVTQTLLATLCERAGYRVTRLGVEELVTEVKFASYDEYRDLGLPAALRYLPDFLIAEPRLQAAFMVEVKFRSSLSRATIADLHAELSRQREHWPNSYAVVMLGHSINGNQNPFHQDYVRVVRPDDLAKLLVPEGSWVGHHWRTLPHLPDVFSRMSGSLELQQNADLITSTLEQLCQLEGRQ
jgi:hypothetical protein